ncbi:XrtN system VIT domain-containing protein [Flavobacterium sp. Fl-77]|uniref:XrtN system VIT domain-containing protein n=1 Tax=Flavobacterium flavipigmentatum TaxID=2893884 RepID=A0AAJ2VZ39_9FLAO|nr:MULTISPECIES: XrtN system VIT domain-containing protein [unclassified Flavobacterium]MDX6183062.1 XrtN system VIT domain-containing protein [Flavobacterium sp. Fl-33]MDX6186869.1 XrtN system VIT domain-containing protein [Flavobacterium sp. Fl-77]UFH37003.1 XrtN system VIT domain-containing protein [Flavobacterium sp. F-70]
MKSKIKFFKEYTQQPGVKISLVLSILSSFILIIALIGKNFLLRQLDSFGALSLIIEFIYGTVLTFLILRKKDKYLHLVPFLILNWFIGCFCTNTIIPIFENLSVWVYLITFAFCLSNFFIYRDVKEKYISKISYFINGLSFTLILYFAVYLIPIIHYSFIGMLALGLGFYGLVPAIVLVLHSYIILGFFQKNKKHFLSFIAGFSILLISLAGFAFKLNAESNKISQNTITQSFENNDDLPNYIKVSQNLKPNFFNEILLKKDVVYIGSENFFLFEGFNSFGSKEFNEKKLHNPFINIAYFFCKDINLNYDDRINILKSNFDKRLETEEQLWSGEDLFTKNIKEDIKIYPNSRLAYTELTIDIACDKESWQDKEAIYSFQLPEGSVATSLSLWVNGIERKGVLTTKEKAANAYKQIVGVENRDPSLMQWKEGNKVVVRIFPINIKMPRTFKCGFTTPLKVEDNLMKYQSLSIKGPSIASAETLSRIQIVGNTKIETSKDFELNNNYFINKSKGLDRWEATIPLNKNRIQDSFVWKNKVYEVKDIQKTTIPFKPSEVILDLNSNWTTQEIKSLLHLSQKKFYVIIDKKKQIINKENFESIQLQFKNLHYSLLPLYKLNKNTLIVTKSGTFSANFEELEDSNYLKKIKSRTKQQYLKVINMSAEINPFWQTIKEQKYVHFYQTSFKNTLQLIEKNQFVLFQSEKKSINIEPANISIKENPKKPSSKSTGSNHIYRMYAFGKVLEEQIKIQNDTLAQNQYTTLAKDANIVTPISSLIVLETDADYKNNGIEKNIDTLGNATINNDGSVPEPHEWLLIIIGLTTLFFYYQRSKKQTN